VQERSIALLALVLAITPALSQDVKTAGTVESECATRFAATDKNGDGYITRTEMIIDPQRIPPALAKESVIARREYIAACMKMQPAQASDSTGPSVSPETKGEPQPQGRTGPLETKSGGAPATSPQGQEPPGMHAAPDGSSKTITDPDTKKDR
jgi:hypothetical protein